MKKIVLLLVVFCVCLWADEMEVEKRAIKKVIQTAYVEGLQNEGNFEKIDAGFHPDFELIGIDEGDNMWHLPLSEWKERVKEKLKKGELPRKEQDLISIKFLDVDVTGTVAVAKFEFYVGKELKYIDYQSLYKFESGWKIVSKVFYKF